MTIEDVISLATNVGFPAAICFILLRYVLETIAERLDKLDKTIGELTQTIREIDDRDKTVKRQK